MDLVDPEAGYESDGSTIGSGSEGSWVTASSLNAEAAEDNNVASTSSPSPEDSAKIQGLDQHGCQHYRRRCMLVAPCCDEAFW